MLSGPEATISRGVREMACRTNTDASGFEAAAENLERTAQISMSKELLRQTVEAEGKRVMAAQEAGTLPPEFQAEDCRVAGEGGEEDKTRMYAGCDGVMVPIITDAEKQARRKKVVEKRRARGGKLAPLEPRKRGADRNWKEFKTITFYNDDQSHRHLILSRARRTATGPIVRREAQRLGFARASEKVGLVDGAAWLRTMFDESQHALQLDALGLDFYHLSENVHKARRSVFGEDDADGKAWADDLMHTFKHEGYEAAYEKLEAWRASLGRSRRKDAADRLLHYVFERRDMIDYPDFQKRGWDIGSGPTESRCKVGTSRLKRAGARWDAPNAEAVAALTNIRHSNQWQLHWKLPVATTA
jgi:hypothetical protein